MPSSINQTTSENNENQTPTNTGTENMKTNAKKGANTTANEDKRWIAQLEDLLKVKNVDDLKSGLGKLALEIQHEIQAFDINQHLSPEAKTRIKQLEQRYANVMRFIQRAQKQFDREVNKSIRVLLKTKQDAEKQISNLRGKIAKHRGTLVKASTDIRKKINKKSKRPAVKKNSKVKKVKSN